MKNNPGCGNVPEWFYRKNKGKYRVYGNGGIECDVKKEWESYINASRVYG